MIHSASRIAKGRRGVSLTEALIAVGILTIGLISLLSLFPVGAVRMAQAVRDDRVAMLGANGDVFFRNMWRNAALNQATTPDVIVSRATLQVNAPWTVFFDDINGITPAPATPSAVIAPADTGASWPILLDPVGSDLNGAWAGGPTNGRGWLARQKPVGSSLIANIRLMYTTDDITFTKSGVPDLPGGNIERAERYSYAWLVQRPNNSVHEEVKLTVLTFQNRAPSITPATEAAYSLVDTGIVPTPSSFVRIDTGSPSTNPIFRKGQWVLIAYQPTAAPPAGPANPFVSAYRVLNLTQLGTTSQWDVEFQQTIPSGSTPITKLRLIAFDTLVEVFDRGVLSPTSAPGYTTGK